MTTRVAPQVAWILSGQDSSVLVARVPDHPPERLEGSGAHLWLCWSDGLGLEAAVAEMVQAYEVPEATVRPEATALFRRLVRQGYLEPGEEDQSVLGPGEDALS